MLLKLTQNLTPLPADLDNQVRRTHVGMAHFAGTGPFGARCGDCAHLGYYKPIRNERGEVVRTPRVGGCAEFHRITGRHGPVVPPSAEACQHFSRKEEER